MRKLCLNFDLDTYSNYPFDEFLPLEICEEQVEYSYYCYTLLKCNLAKEPSFFLRITNIDIVDNINFIFYCPAYKKDLDFMAKRKTVLLEPNKLGLTPGKLSIDLDDLPPINTALNSENSYYDAKLKKRVPNLLLVEQTTPTEEKEKAKKVKIENEMVNNLDILVEGKIHSSHFLPPFICTRLWTLSRGTKTGWGWYLRVVDGFKNKYEYYCRPIENSEEQYNRGGDMFTFAYLKAEYPQLDVSELSQENIIMLSKAFEVKSIDSIQVAIDALETKIGNNACPECGYVMDCATGAYEDSVTPNPHDLSLCLNCGEMLEFSDDMEMIKLHPVILDSLPQETQYQLIKAQRIIVNSEFYKTLKK